jgi:hypothetical protein
VNALQATPDNQKRIMRVTYYTDAIEHDPYSQLRTVVAPQLVMLPPDQLRLSIDSQFGEGYADQIESDLGEFWGSIGRALSNTARDVGQAVQRAAPAIAHVAGGVVQGAMAGSSAGLPGIIAGAAVGGTGAGLSRYGQGSARDVGNALNTATQFASQLSPLGRVGGTLGQTVSGLGGLARGGPNAGGQAASILMQGAGGLLGQIGGGAAGGAGQQFAGQGGMPGRSLPGRSAPGNGIGQIAGLLGSPQIGGLLSGMFGGSGAAGQLASALQRPEIHQALAAQRLGPLGANTIATGINRNPVPAAAFAQLIAMLAQQAAQESVWTENAETAEAADFAFMGDGQGGFSGDPSLAEDRASHLWNLLNESQAERLVEAIAFETESLDEYAGNWAVDDFDNWNDADSDGAFYDSFGDYGSDEDAADGADDFEGADCAW